MSQQPVAWDAIPYTRMFPWLRFGRVFWIALDPRLLTLGSCAVLLLLGSGKVLEHLLPRTLEEKRIVSAAEENLFDLADSGSSLLDGGVKLRWPFLARGQVPALLPLQPLSQPTAYFFEPLSVWLNPRSSLQDRVRSGLWLLIAGLIWSWFGCAMGRISAVRLARRQQVSLWDGLKYSFSRTVDLLAAPGLPLFGIAVCGIGCGVVGFLSAIPVAGELILALMWGLLLLAGLVILILWLGLFFGWPLMIAAINVEGCDGFEAFSRSYNYIIERIWHYLGYWLLTAILAAFTTLITGGVIFLTWQIAVVSTSLWVGSPVVELIPSDPLIIDWKLAASTSTHSATESAIALRVFWYWQQLLALVLISYVQSFYWTSTILIYFLLRRSIDANDFDEIYLPQQPDEDLLTPMVQPTVSTSIDSAAGGQPPPVA